MNTADKIGLLPGFRWLADHGIIQTMIIWLAVTPGMMFIIGIIGESRLLPIAAEKQFLSFFPGDIYLGTGVTGMLILAQKLPEGKFWYNGRIWHLVVLAATSGVAFMITRGECLDPNGYGRRAVLSPTKLYHNGMLYGLYSYVIVVLVFALVGGLLVHWNWESFGLLVVCLLPMLLWAACLVLEQNDAFIGKFIAHDGQTVAEAKAERMQSAHTTEWQPIWAH